MRELLMEMLPRLKERAAELDAAFQLASQRYNEAHAQLCETRAETLAAGRLVEQAEAIIAGDYEEVPL